MKPLAQRKCVPCEAGTPPMTREESEKYLAEVPGWELVEQDGQLRIRKRYAVSNFDSAMEFANRIWKLAQEEDHHPVLLISYGRVRVDLVTHIINGLSENDFIMAVKINELSKVGEES